ncbi:unnamed protein product [Mytilus coruscus]|uniref:Uncharacterized protein n=1 Tax=Mytilus coruscus TaxID=42192 RepID=A0A6J8DN54_MYTCO|nr:unnamed protein product [Mytilus coruscus]
MAARTRKPTRKYIAKRRNGHYTSPAVAVKATKTCSSEVPLHKVKRKLHFGRKPPIQREKANNLKKKRERSKLQTKKQTFGKATVKNKRKRISKELLDLLDMADHFIYSEKLRSKNLKRPCHGDHGMHMVPISYILLMSTASAYSASLLQCFIIPADSARVVS